VLSESLQTANFVVFSSGGGSVLSRLVLTYPQQNLETKLCDPGYGHQVTHSKLPLELLHTR
jgi:hypothetical protein